MKDLVIPGKTLDELHLKPSELLIDLAVYLYDIEKLSMGRAKKLAGLSQIEFQKEMAQREVRLNYDISDLELDLKNLKDLDVKEAKMAMASKLYELGKLSLGQAADLVGYSKATFMELLADYGVSYFNQDADELDEDIKNAENYSL